MKFKTIPVFILLFAGYFCNAQDAETTPTDTIGHKETSEVSMRNGTHIENTLLSPETETQGSGDVPGRSLPTLVVAGVSIALVLLCILIVAVFWYAWRKSQEGSIELNPIPYGDAGVSLRSLSVPENQQEWPFERAAP